MSDVLNNDTDPSQVAFGLRPDRFKTFKLNSNQKETERKWIFTVLLSQDTDFYKAVLTSDNLHISFLGVGDGQAELDFLEDIIRLRTKGNRGIALHAEDPSEQMKGLFFAELQKRNLQELKVGFDLRKIEDFTYQIPDSDLIIASHIMYYVSGWEDDNNPNNPLIKIINSIKSKNGKAMIILHNEESDRYKLLQYYRELTGNPIPETSGQAVMNVLNRLHPSGEACFKKESKLNINCLCETTNEGNGDFTKFKPNDEGKALLSFIFRTDWDKVPTEIQKKLGHKIMELAYPQVVQRQNFKTGDSFMWLKLIDDYIYIHNVLESEKLQELTDS